MSTSAANSGTRYRRRKKKKGLSNPFSLSRGDPHRNQITYKLVWFIMLIGLVFWSYEIYVCLLRDLPSGVGESTTTTLEGSKESRLGKTRHRSGANNAEKRVPHQDSIHKQFNSDNHNKKKPNVRRGERVNNESSNIESTIATTDGYNNELHLDGERGTEKLVLTTKHGQIRIVLRQDLSPESVQYVHEMVSSGSCPKCNFYRAEKPGILQGIFANPDVKKNKVLGTCPPEYRKNKKPENCPQWDPHCGCHGPIMTKGMVAWAAGQSGPDFFIDTYKQQANWWENQHTVWGEIRDDASFAILDLIYSLPVNKGGMTMLKDKIEFSAKIVKSR